MSEHIDIGMTPQYVIVQIPRERVRSIQTGADFVSVELDSQPATTAHDVAATSQPSDDTTTVDTYPLEGASEDIGDAIARMEHCGIVGAELVLERLYCAASDIDRYLDEMASI